MAMDEHSRTVAVIGGGASGILAALTASQLPDTRVLLLERQQRVGRKLLATGNGRCNLTNLHARPDSYFGTDASFAGPALRCFMPQDTLTFFSDLGLLTVAEESGRIYPLSDSANSVLDVLRFALDRAGVELHCSFPVEELSMDGAGFRIRGAEETIRADRVILACGGAAGAKLGGCMDGYRLAKGLGHKRTSLYPSLTRILTKSDYPRSLKGIRADASLRLTNGEVLLGSGRGEVQFTETGVSGPAGFDLSRTVSIGGGERTLHLQLLPFEEEEILSLLLRRQQSFPLLDSSDLFTGMLHNRLGRVLVKASGISAGKPLSELSAGELRKAARCCFDFRLPVTGVEGFDTAQVTAGGLVTDSFRPDTLESRLVPGLFACGELLDIDGPCGGYNLQWAWASGRLAGRLGT